MKFLLIATFVALATASAIYTNKVISLTEDGSFYITAANGKSVVITRPIALNGQRYIEVGLNGPTTPLKKIEITDDSLFGQAPFTSKVYGDVEEELVLKKGHPSVETQGEVLFQILYQYQGTVTAPLYEEFLYRIQRAVQQGLLTQHFYDIFAGIDQIDEVFARVFSSFTGNQIFKQGGVYNKEFNNGLNALSYGYGNTVYPGYSSEIRRAYPGFSGQQQYYGNSEVNQYYGRSGLNQYYGRSGLNQYYGKTGLNQVYGNGLNQFYGLRDQQSATPYVNSWFQRYAPSGQYYNNYNQEGFYGTGYSGNNVYNRLYNQNNGGLQGYGYGYQQQQPYGLNRQFYNRQYAY